MGLKRSPTSIIK